MGSEYENIKVPAKIELAEIYDFIDSGDPSNAPSEIVDYLDALEKVRSMTYRPKQFATKEHIISHLEKVNGLSRDLATRIYDHSIEYYHLDSSISKQAHRNLYAEQQDEDIALARLASKGIDDLEKISKMRERAYKFRALHEPDVQDFPDGSFDKPFKLYTTDPEKVGIPKADRRVVSTFIDSLPELTEIEIQILQMEAGNLPFKAFLSPLEDPRYQANEE